MLRLPFLLKYHRELGIDRFFFIDNGSTDGSVDYILEQDDCHLFTSTGNFFAENVKPPAWSNALRNVYGDGYWCLSLDADEMYVFPHCEDVTIRTFCDFLDECAVNAVVALVVDMYGKEPVLQTRYTPGESFLTACPYFDPEIGEQVAVDTSCPPLLTFSRFRERAFWSGRHKRKHSPCITQVPLVKWKTGTGYLVAQHTLNRGILSDVEAAVLHFKFLPGFLEAVAASLKNNPNVSEKGLEERQSYVDTLTRNRDLSLFYEGSQKYENSSQLTKLGWMKTSERYEVFVNEQPEGSERLNGRHEVTGLLQE